MLTLKSLTFENIGRFIDSQTIDFSTLDELNQVEGKNNVTGGSSGAAKSTVFKALEFLLGVNNIPVSVLQSRLTEKHISVCGLFDYDGLPLKIERGKKLLIDLNGEITTGSSYITEKKLDKIIGMDRDLFRKILHKRQGEGGFFLEMGASKIHKFLTKCLNLEKEQAKIVTVDSDLESLSDKEVSVKTSLESSKSALDATLNAISSLGSPPVAPAPMDLIEGLKAKHSLDSKAYSEAKESHKKELEELEKDRPIVQTTPFDRSQIELLEKEISFILNKITKLEKIEIDRQSSLKSKINELQIAIGNLNNEEQKRQYEVKSKMSSNRSEYERALYCINEGERAKQKAIKLADELKKIRASICPTCEQSWINDSIKVKENEILTKLKELKNVVIAGTTSSECLPEIEKEYENLRIDSQPRIVQEIQIFNDQIAQYRIDSQPQVVQEAVELKLKIDFKKQELAKTRQEERDHQFKENAKTQSILVNFAQKQTEVNQRHQFYIEAAQNAVSKSYNDLQSALASLKAFEESQKRFNDSYDKLQAQSFRHNDEIVTKNLELASILDQIEVAEESKKAIKSYLSCSFENALDSIGDTATRLIRGIPNMGTATIQFDGLKEIKDGKIKEEINAVISMDGEIGIPIKSLSGGEKSSVDLGVDLAVINFIEERTSKGINIIVLDEPFTGLDTRCCEDAIEMLRNCSVGKKILLVDHNPVVAQSIENKITVIRDGLTSKVVQQ